MDIYEEVTSAAYVHLKSFNPIFLIPLRKCREENLDLEVSSPSGDIFSIWSSISTWSFHLHHFKFFFPLEVLLPIDLKLH